MNTHMHARARIKTELGDSERAMDSRACLNHFARVICRLLTSGCSSPRSPLSQSAPDSDWSLINDAEPCGMSPRRARKRRRRRSIDHCSSLYTRWHCARTPPPPSHPRINQRPVPPGLQLWYAECGSPVIGGDQSQPASGMAALGLLVVFLWK